MKDKFIVCIVDDDIEDLELLSEAFEMSGRASAIKCFTRGTELMELMTLRRIEIPDIIILDHYLSLKDETNLPAMIRKEKKYDSITLAVYSYSLSPGKIEQLLQKGVDVCKQKGCGVAEMKIDVEAFCEAAHAKRRQ